MAVIPFPGKRKLDVSKERMSDTIEELEYLYENLERAYEIIHTLEEKTSILEKEYNEMFRNYVAQVEDHEQVEIRFLNYSTEANVEEDSEGNLRIRFYGEAPEAETPL